MTSARAIEAVDLARLLAISDNVSLVISDTPRESLSLSLSEDVSVAERWRRLHEVLAASGYGIVRTADRAFVLTTSEKAQRLAAVVPREAIDSEPDASGYMRIRYRPRAIRGPDVMEILRAIAPGETVKAESIGSTGEFVLSGPRVSLGNAVALLDEFDARVARPETTVFRLRSLSPEAAIQGVERLVGDGIGASRGGIGMTAAMYPGPVPGTLLVRGTTLDIEAVGQALNVLDVAESPERRVYELGPFAAEDVQRLLIELFSDGSAGQASLRTIVDDLTGSLVIDATPSQHEEIAAWLEQLAQAPPSTSRSVARIVLENRPAEDVRGAIESMLDLGVLDQADGSDGGMRAGADDQGLRLAVDEGTNSLVATGTPRQLARLRELVEELDVRRPQVMLDVLIVALNESDTLDLGIELQKIEINGATTINLASLFGLTDGGGDDNAEFGGGEGFTGSVIRPGDFSVLVRALKRVSDGQTLSRPRVLVNNNESATLDSVVQEPFTSTNASDTVATTSFGGTQDAGTSITIRPQIAEGDHLVLEYSVSLSAFTGESASPNIPPPRQQNQVQSIVTIPDGYTVVVGGFELQTEAEADSKVPVLGDIPLLGYLFQTTSQSTTVTRFYVFITAGVMRSQDFEELKYLSDQTLGEAAVDPRYAGWPVVEPRLIR